MEEIRRQSVEETVVIDKEIKYSFDIDEYYHFIKLTKDKYKELDNHLIEYIVASYLIYDKNGVEKPDENHPDFVKQNEKIKELIENTRLVIEELKANEKNEVSIETNEVCGMNEMEKNISNKEEEQEHNDIVS